MCTSYQNRLMQSHSESFHSTVSKELLSAGLRRGACIQWEIQLHAICGSERQTGIGVQCHPAELAADALSRCCVPRAPENSAQADECAPVCQAGN